MEQKEATAALIRRSMPKVAQMVAEKRRAWGDEHVTLCQQKGMGGAPGWFFAREGPLAVGTPWADDPEIAQYAAGLLPPGATFVCLRPPEVADGAH